MRIIRLFQPGTYQASETICLNDNAAHHAAVVLRLKPGNHITLFNGNNEEFDGTITDIDKKRVQVSVLNRRVVNRESPCKIHLGQAIVKSDRMAWLIQKAVELGVDQITPLLSDHMAIGYDEKRLTKKISQWQNIIVAACEQSGRNQLPHLNPAVSAKTWFAQKHPYPLILSPGSMSRIDQTMFVPDNMLTVAIGPEGGWSADEEQQAFSHQWRAIGLGPRILRAETAALCTLTLLQGFMGDI